MSRVIYQKPKRKNHFEMTIGITTLILFLVLAQYSQKKNADYDVKGLNTLVASLQTKKQS